jgi:large subunit ribosomal protein L22
MATAKAQLTNYRQAPRKVRLVADLVRGKSAARALMLLETLPKRASLPMAKLIRSAVANSNGASANDLYISKIAVDGGIVFKRMMPRARGRGAQILKRTSHVVVELETKTAPKKAKAKSKAAPKAEEATTESAQ